MTTGNKICIAIISILAAFFSIIIIKECAHDNRYTNIYRIEDNDFEKIEAERGMIYYYIDNQTLKQCKNISADSTYFYNSTDEDWLLYSVDYTVPGKTTKQLPDEVYVMIPPHTMLGTEKIPAYISSYSPPLDFTLYGYEAERGYSRHFFLRKLSVVLEEDLQEKELLKDFLKDIFPSL